MPRQPGTRRVTRGRLNADVRGPLWATNLAVGLSSGPQVKTGVVEVSSVQGPLSLEEGVSGGVPPPGYL